MSARYRLLILTGLLSGGCVWGCAWHYPMPVYPPFPPDHGYSAPYDPQQQLGPAVDDATLLEQSAPPLSGS